jgi:hypothetical protein
VRLAVMMTGLAVSIVMTVHVVTMTAVAVHLAVVLVATIALVILTKIVHVVKTPALLHNVVLMR